MRFIDTFAYVQQALHALGPHPVPGVPEAHWTWLGVGLALLSVVLAVVCAFVAIYVQRVPALLRTATARTVAPPLRVVRRLHSGHVGDYVAWLVVGVAGLAALVGFPLR